MKPDKSALKRQIDQSRPNELLVINVSKPEKNLLQIYQKEIEKFIKKGQDYIIIVIGR